MAPVEWRNVIPDSGVMLVNLGSPGEAATWTGLLWCRCRTVRPRSGGIIREPSRSPNTIRATSKGSARTQRGLDGLPGHWLVFAGAGVPAWGSRCVFFCEDLLTIAGCNRAYEVKVAPLLCYRLGVPAASGMGCAGVRVACRKAGRLTRGIERCYADL